MCAAWLAGCNALFGIDDLTSEGTVESTSGTSGNGGASVASVGAGSAGPGSGGNTESASGGAGGCMDCLVDRGLVARYFIDEADSGQAPMTLTDAAPNPLALDIEYGGGGSVLSFTGSPGRRALSWSHVGTAQKAHAAIGGTKIFSQLHGSSQGTIEMVMDVLEVILGAETLFLVIGPGGNSGGFSLAAEPSSVDLAWHDGQSVGSWPFTLVGAGRLVLHAVLDTGNTDPGARARLYVNGQPNPVPNAIPVNNGEVIDLSPDIELVIGSGVAAARSPRGTIAYAALYNVALTETEIEINVARLTASDDAQ